MQRYEIICNLANILRIFLGKTEAYDLTTLSYYIYNNVWDLLKREKEAMILLKIPKSWCYMRNYS